jgi:hypothetical protein
MSRIPLEKCWSPNTENVECHFLEDDLETAVTSDLIRQKTMKDPVLSKVLRYTQSGWPSRVDDPSFAPYMSRKLELSVEQGCLLWGSRVVIPPSLRELVLSELHLTHPGMVRMKSLARSYVWWPHLDGQIEDMVSSCEVCQALRADPPKAQVHPWMFPSKPWSRLHVDYAGPIGSFMYLVLVDAYSKFPEVVKMRSTTSTATINVLRSIFSR